MLIFQDHILDLVSSVQIIATLLTSLASARLNLHRDLDVVFFELRLHMLLPFVNLHVPPTENSLSVKLFTTAETF